MSGYRMKQKSRCHFFLLISTIVAFLAGCQDSLTLKDEIEARVLDSLSMLELSDAATGAKIWHGDTFSWPHTIYGETAKKTFRLSNKGGSTITLVGAAPVRIGGGTGQAAFAEEINQPRQSILPPGASTEFSLTFKPAEPEINYYCTVIVGSDDPTIPGFSFTASGRSTQWHGLTVIDDSASGAFFSPQLCVDGNSVYATYSLSSGSAIAIRGSSDGGRNWTSAFGGQIAGGPYPHLTALTGASSANPGLHIMYYGNTQVSYNKNLSDLWQLPDILNVDATAGTADQIYGNLLLRDGVFLTWYDSPTQSLWYNYSRDPRPQEGAEEKVDTFWQRDPIQLTGGSTGRDDGRYHSIKRDSSGDLYLAYLGIDEDDVKKVMLIRAASTSLNFDANTIESTGPAAQHGIVIALTESAGVTTVHAVYAIGSELFYSSTTSADLHAWTPPLSLGADSHHGGNFRFEIGEDGRLYVLHQRHGAQGGIILSSSVNSGATWSHRILDSHTSLSSGAFMSHMALDVSGQTIYAAYTTGSDYPGGYSVTLMKSIDGGATW